ncbi:MAG: DNA mismatch repair endonuclease MutL [Chloroflexi bacterium]|nr:DNA mismatch repair endonuclease MutL [Chloroflexota bacterium]MBU1748409.1 DNA mismatch repair endonuclease MutL [Chloroflexota bacterium]
MPIQILSPAVAAKIAAGEVVERPASVVKELVENSIDAGATHITVEVREGGVRLIRVADDGCGIPAAEVLVAFARHATSKLQAVEDLEHLATLGFRGEALPSIAAVSRTTLLTRARDEAAGSFITVEGGEVREEGRRGAPTGTTVTVEHLFATVPARLKFLRTHATEAGHIVALLRCYALACPEIAFHLLVDGRTLLRSSGNGQARDALVAVYDIDIAQRLIEVGDNSEPVRCHGFISPPDLTRSTRRDLVFFVNRRWVESRSLSYATEQAYHTMLPVGRHPIVALHLEMDPALVDVNVHPSKREVKFRDEGAVFRAVGRAVRHALLAQSPIPEVGDASPAVLRPGTAAFEAHQRRFEMRQADRGAGFDTPSPHPADDERLPPLRVLGQIGQTYIIAEGPGGLYLIDQHAAHERVLYERWQAQRAGGAPVPAQALLEPLAVPATPPQEEAVYEYGDPLAALGFQVESFGPGTVLVRAVPDLLTGAPDLALALADVFDELATSGSALAREQDEAIARAVCKQGAVKAGQTLDADEMRALIRDLEATAMPRTCPHGRPTMIHLSRAMLEREFGRR